LEILVLKMNKIEQRIFLFALISLFFFSAIFLYKPIVAISLDSPAATICVDPPTTTAGVGQTFAININVSSVSDLYGWEFNLTWNPILLDFVSVTEGPFLKSGGSTFFTYKNETSYILVDCTLLGDIPGVNGDGILATVKFYVECGGECSLDLYDTKLVSSLEQPITHTAIDGYFTGPSGPTAKFTYLAPYPYWTVTFNASTSLSGWNGTHVAPIIKYEWNFGDGNITAVSYPVIDHTYATNDTHTVVLNVTDSQGLWDTTSQTITVSPDIAIISVTPGDGYVGHLLNIDITVKNEGVTIETFNVTAYYTNETHTASIGTKTVTKLAPGAEENLTLAWSLSGISVGGYTISANASVVLNETDTADNTKVDGIAKVKWPGDANGDGKINVIDLGMLGRAWLSNYGEPKYDPRCDFNGDGKINVLDLGILGLWWLYPD